MPPSRATATEVWPGVYRLQAPYSNELNAWVKNGLGWKFDGDLEYGPKKAWYLGKERLQGLADFCARKGWALSVAEESRTYTTDVLEHLPEDLTPWQREGIFRALGSRALLAQWMTGAGKSRFAIEVLKVLGPEAKALIICPKVVLRTWEEEQLPKWLGCNAEGNPQWWALLAGRKLTLKEGRGEEAIETLRPQPKVLLCSWDSMHKIPEDWPFDLIVYDECHYGIHGDTKRTQEASRLSARNKRAIRLGLSATPTSSSLTDLWGPLHLLCPHRWGSFKRWWTRYFEEVPVGHEDYVKPGGLKEGPTREELLSQLEAICHFVGIDDVGDYLPPVQWKQLDIGLKNAERVTAPETVREWLKEQRGNGSLRIEGFKRAVASGEVTLDIAPTAIVVYHRDLGERLAAELGAAYVSGELSTKQRHAVLAEAPVAVMTMRSVTEGLDLRRFANVYVVEAYPVPLYLTQVLGRFVRLYASEAVSITFCRLHGSSDDVVIHRLLTHLSEHGKLVKQGKIETGLRALLNTDIDSDAFLRELREACAGDGSDETDREDWEEWAEDWD